MPRLKMYTARNGDAFLVDADSAHLLIDAGYASTYHDHIAPDLMKSAAAGGRLDLVVCTHIDADHIGGLLEFFSSNGPEGRRGIEVVQVWHNSLRSLPMTPGQSLDQDTVVLEAIRRRGFPRQSGAPLSPISAKQGSSLAKLLHEHRYRWNSGQGTDSIMKAATSVPISADVGVHVIGPTKRRLEELRDFWLREVRKLGHSGLGQPSDLLDDAFEMWCTRMPAPLVAQVKPIGAKNGLRLVDVYTPDLSIPNRSSIAFILRAGQSQMLFLGDSPAEDVVDSLRAHRTPGETLTFDVIKVSHHGSLRNTSVELLEMVDAPCFLISSDGSGHGHPDFEVLAEIVDRPAPFERQLFFNYETDACKRLRAHVSRSGSAFRVHVVQNEWIEVGGARK